MPDFSVISQDPTIRAIVQSNLLERAFHDALYPRLLFRGEATPETWPANVGDTMVFTGKGLIPVNATPLVPGTDAPVADYQKEQWTATLQQYASSIDTQMPTSITAIANMFLTNAQQLGLMAGQTMNRIVRDRLYQAALSGWTVTSVASGPSTTISVVRLNGFTTARRPDLATGSPVQFALVSATNPLPITVTTTTGTVSVNVVGFTPATSGDQLGPGTLTLDTSVTVALRAAIYSNDRTFIQRVGGGFSVDSVLSNDILRMADMRACIANLRQNNVPEFPDLRYHCHLDPVSETQIFADPEFQRLNTSLPDYIFYRALALGEIQGTIFFRNTENPLPETVVGGTYSVADPFVGELLNATSVRIHRPIFLGQGGIFEYYQELDQLITEAGITGRVGKPQVTSNSIEVNTERITLVIRAPLNRLQDQVSSTWKFIGDWPLRTDITSGSAARFKREVVAEHGE